MYERIIKMHLIIIYHIRMLKTILQLSLIFHLL